MSTNINEILARAAALRDETTLNSISPDRAGGIMYDTLLAMNELWLQQGSALVISKIYASVAAMEADLAPVSDLTGQPLRPGQIVVIVSSDSDNGSVYRYDGTEDDTSSWSLVGAIGSLPVVDSLDSDSSTLPLAARQGKALDAKIDEVVDDAVASMIAARDYAVSGNVVYDDNEIPQSFDIVWSDGTSGTVSKSDFNQNVFEYGIITATYKTLTIVYTVVYDSNGYIISETFNIE